MSNAQSVQNHYPFDWENAGDLWVVPVIPNAITRAIYPAIKKTTRPKPLKVAYVLCANHRSSFVTENMENLLAAAIIQNANTLNHSSNQKTPKWHVPNAKKVTLSNANHDVEKYFFPVIVIPIAIMPSGIHR